jgi:hypothetical protein
LAIIKVAAKLAVHRNKRWFGVLADVVIIISS